MKGKRLRWLASLLWSLTTTTARLARHVEGLSFHVGVAPGFDFDNEGYWWDLCQQEQFRAAVKAISSAETAKCLEIMSQQAQAATGRPLERWQEVAASAAAAAMFREMPFLFQAYGGRYAKTKKREVNESTNTTVGRRQ